MKKSNKLWQHKSVFSITRRRDEREIWRINSIVFIFILNHIPIKSLKRSVENTRTRVYKNPKLKS